MQCERASSLSLSLHDSAQHPYPPVENRGELSPLTPKAHFHDNEIAYCFTVDALVPRLGIEPKFGEPQSPVLSNYTTLGI